MKRYQSRNISRSRTRIEALNPSKRFSFNMGQNRLAALFASLLLTTKPTSPEEKAKKHALTMRTEQNKAKARSQRRQKKGNA
jgi:hypothetical protein